MNNPDNTSTALEQELAALAKIIDNFKLVITGANIQGNLRTGMTGNIDSSNQANSSGGLPSGTNGDILYNNGAAWVILNPPSSDGNVYVLTMQNNVPSWVQTTTC